MLSIATKRQLPIKNTIFSLTTKESWNIKNGKSFITNNLYPFKKIRFYYISVLTYQQKLDFLYNLEQIHQVKFWFIMIAALKNNF